MKIGNIIDKLKSTSLNDIKRNTVSKFNSYEEAEIAEKLGFTRVGITEAGTEMYTLNGSKMINLLGHNFNYLYCKLFTLNLYPVLDRYGMIRDCSKAYQASSNITVARETTLDKEIKESGNALIAYERYNIPICIPHRTLNITKSASKGDIKLSSGAYAKISLGSKMMLKSWGNYSLYKVYNNTSTNIPCEMNTNHDYKDIRWIAPGGTALITEDSLHSIMKNKIADNRFADDLSSEMTRILRREGTDAARGYLANGDKYSEKDKYRKQYDTSKIRCNLNRQGFMLANKPFNVNRDKELLKSFLNADSYMAIMEFYVPGWTEKDEITYELEYKLVNSSNETVGYRVKATNNLRGFNEFRDMSLKEVEYIVDNDKVLNATMVVSETKKPYIRCNKELTKISI